MATVARTVTQGETISLYIEVRNKQGVLVNSETTPLVSIFDFDSDPRISTTTDADAVVLNSVGATNIAQGIYKFDYSVASDAHVGTWFDRWVITVDSILTVAVFQFSIEASSPPSDSSSVNSGTQALLQNNVIVITLTDDIGAADGTYISEEFQYYFTTQYNPLYSSVRRIRLRAGEYIQTVPDDTINLAIFEASLAVDSLTFGMQFPPGTAGIRYGYEIGNGEINPTYFLRNRRTGEYFEYARQEYVTCMAIIYMLSNTLGPAAKKKSLADFSVEYGDGALKQFMDDLKNECKEWERVIQSGGFVTKGASIPMRVANKGVRGDDYHPIGRREMEGGTAPGANTRVQHPGPQSRWKHTWKQNI